MTIRHLTTFEAVLAELGGYRRVASLAGLTVPAIYRWRRDLGDRFPAWMYARVCDELARRNCSAARAVFLFEPPRTTVRRKTAG